MGGWGRSLGHFLAAVALVCACYPVQAQKLQHSVPWLLCEESGEPVEWVWSDVDVKIAHWSAGVQLQRCQAYSCLGCSPRGRLGSETPAGEEQSFIALFRTQDGEVGGIEAVSWPVEETSWQGVRLHWPSDNGRGGGEAPIGLLGRSYSDRDGDLPHVVLLGQRIGPVLDNSELATGKGGLSLCSLGGMEEGCAEISCEGAPCGSGYFDCEQRVGRPASCRVVIGSWLSDSVSVRMRTGVTHSFGDSELERTEVGDFILPVNVLLDALGDVQPYEDSISFHSGVLEHTAVPTATAMPMTSKGWLPSPSAKPSSPRSPLSVDAFIPRNVSVSPMLPRPTATKLPNSPSPSVSYTASASLSVAIAPLEVTSDWYWMDDDLAVLSALAAGVLFLFFTVVLITLLYVMVTSFVSKRQMRAPSAESSDDLTTPLVATHSIN